ncbi:MAG TPA: DmsC/YnfH family molybdoenzyme membrane anchor subunit [Acetobacteraceae bacterium]|jgi:DMSO reductase anchor subunit|nr:DmsC/YnfH family molybdoenzyme membrane anchor subunit [Acetobacteraceae bacterium]
MNPAFSVIILTTASGAGYGMLVWLGVLGVFGALPQERWFGVVAALLALALSAAGLLASTFHLGHPERAWRAISQWRSSWLSREGVLGLFTNLPGVAFAAAWWFGGPTIVIGLVAGLCGLATVASQAMIYASLKPIRQWCNSYVLPNFLLLSLYSGAIWLVAAGAGTAAALIGIVLAVIAAGAKWSYWRFIDAAQPIATIESATGLGAIGKVRPLEDPHTEENYLLREMGYVIGRKHAAKLRVIALVVGFAVPVVLLVIGLAVAGVACAVAAALAALAGIYIERWLFFAEATHTVTLYYGQRRAAA